MPAITSLIMRTAAIVCGLYGLWQAARRVMRTTQGVRPQAGRRPDQAKPSAGELWILTPGAADKISRTLQAAYEDRKHDAAHHETVRAHARGSVAVQGPSFTEQGIRSLVRAIHEDFESALCAECQAPVCAMHCPARALTPGPMGRVVHDPERCVACRACALACPGRVLVFDWFSTVPFRPLAPDVKSK